MTTLKHKPILILASFILLLVKGFRAFPRATLLSAWVTAVRVKEATLSTWDLVVLTNVSCFSDEIDIVVLVVWLLLERCLADWVEITTFTPGCIVVDADG